MNFKGQCVGAPHIYHPMINNKIWLYKIVMANKKVQQTLDIDIYTAEVGGYSPFADLRVDVLLAGTRIIQGIRMILSFLIHNKQCRWIVKLFSSKSECCHDNDEHKKNSIRFNLSTTKSRKK